MRADKLGVICFVLGTMGTWEQGNIDRGFACSHCKMAMGTMGTLEPNLFPFKMRWEQIRAQWEHRNWLRDNYLRTLVPMFPLFPRKNSKAVNAKRIASLDCSKTRRLRRVSAAAPGFPHTAKNHK